MKILKNKSCKLFLLGQRSISFYAYSENILQVFYYSRRKRQKYRIIFGESTKSL
jgi:hypothetical protein